MAEIGPASAQPERPAPAMPPRPMPKWMSLRTKGLLAFAALIAYAAVVSVIVLHKKDLALGQVVELQRVYKLGEVLRRVNTALFHTVIVVNDAIYSNPRQVDFQAIGLGHKLIQASHAELVAEIPHSAPTLEILDQSFAKASADPTKDNLIEFAQKLNVMVKALADLTNEAREREAILTQQYRLGSDSVFMTALVLGLLGMVLFGAIIILFFTRLITDLQALQTRAAEIVRGYRGPPLAIHRHDEVGQLMHAVNHMAADLQEHEKQLAIERQKYFHQEKMAAIGALAAGVAHEIGNPIAALSGIAQAIKEVQQSGQCPSPPDICQPDLILSQISRLAQITREISDFASSRPAERELVDLNALIRSTLSLVRFDKRFMRIELQLDLDSQLPAISCVGDQVIQVIMNLLINAADALEHVEGRMPQVTVATSRTNRHACISVEDNGCGMDDRTLSQAADAFFTTKPAGRGTGLGLALCKSIADSHGGRLDIESGLDVGTRVRFLLPLPEELRMTA